MKNNLKEIAQEIVEYLEHCSFNNVTDSSGYYTIKEIPDNDYGRAVDVHKSDGEGTENPHYVVYCSFENEDFSYEYTKDLSVDGLYVVLQELYDYNVNEQEEENMKNNNKMMLVMRDGRELEVDTNYSLMNNQYVTVNDGRVYDVDVHHIINDKRIGLYCCSVKQGTYNEVLESIKEHRTHIKQCMNCDGKGKKCCWYQINERLVDDKKEDRRIEDGKMIIDTVSHIEYSMHCSYGNKCKYDIDEEPKLFTDVQECFFVKYPNGVPDNTDFIQWLIDNHETTNVIPYWSNSTLENCNSLKLNVKLGSYVLEIRKSGFHGVNFELENNRDKHRFAYDFENKVFIEDEGIGYAVRKALYKNSYRKELITCWDKFKKVWDRLVKLYTEQIKPNECPYCGNTHSSFELELTDEQKWYCPFCNKNYFVRFNSNKQIIDVTDAKDKTLI